jgi:FG-GAP-like repeat
MQGEGVVPAANDRLDSWKEIAAYLKREVRTVQRWERLEGLPVHRHQHRKRGSVYAIKSELDVWQLGRRLQPSHESEGVSPPGKPEEPAALATPPGQPKARWHRGSIAILLTCFLVLVVGAGYLAGRHSRAQTASQALKEAQGTDAPVLVVVGDFNGDGKMDVALTRLFSNSISVFFGANEGGFKAQSAYSVNGTITGMAAGDFDRNGRSDLAVAADTSRVIILLADGQIGFRPHQEISVPGVSTISAGDLNSNGKVDLVASGKDPASLLVLWGNGDGTFAFPQPLSGAAARSAATLLGEEADWPEQ